METLLSDVRYALRTLRTNPGVIAIAVLSLGLGIGANTTIFSAVDVFMLRPLPYPDAGRLVSPYSTVPERGWTNVSSSIPDALDFRTESRTMDIAAWHGQSFNLSGGDMPERLNGDRITWNLFQVLQTQPAMGRAFLPEEEREGQHRVAILSDGLWQRRFGGDPQIVGRSILLDGDPYAVVGVMPPKFWFGQMTTEIWTPMPISGEESRGSHFVGMVARLRDGAMLEQAATEMAAIARRLEEAYPESNAGWGASAHSLHREVFREEFRMGSLISAVAVTFVLLIACANVANLMLTRAAGRSREIAVRGALGASRSRIVRQLLTESVMISIMGGALGVVLAIAGIRGLVSLMPPWFPRIDEIGLDGRALAFTAVITLATGLLFGLAPALQASRPNLTDSLKEGGRGNVGGRGDKLRKALVVSEVSLALTLLVASALLVQGFLRLQTGDFGWDNNNVLTFRLALSENEYPDDEAVRSFYGELMPRLASLPGVSAVGGTSILPTHGNSSISYTLPDLEDRGGGLNPSVSLRYVIPGYFQTMRTEMVSGRSFGNEDRADTRPVVVINEAMRDRHWAGANPIGQQIRFSSGPREIVGVVRNTLDLGPEPRPMAFLALDQNPRRMMALVVRTSGEPDDLIEPIRAEVIALDPNMPVYAARAMTDLMREQQGGNTIMAKIMAAVALIALVLAVVGVYGVMAYSVSKRTQEMGIRMALGALPRDVVRMVLRQAALLALLGVAIGVLLASMVTRSLSLFLFGVNPFDPLTFGGVALMLLLAASAASLLPARRATRVDPVEALRYE